MPKQNRKLQGSDEKKREKKTEKERPRAPREEVVEEREENRVMTDTELPRTLSMDILKATTSWPIDVDERKSRQGGEKKTQSKGLMRRIG